MNYTQKGYLMRLFFVVVSIFMYWVVLQLKKKGLKVIVLALGC